MLNPYTPVATNWGMKFFTDSNRDSGDLPESSVYGLTDTLNDQEFFDMYLSWNPAWYPEFDGDALDLWAFEHRDMSEYPELLTDELKGQSANLGCFDYDEESDLAHIRTYIPNKEGDGLDPCRTDLLITYAGDVVVGLVTVDVIG